MTSTQPTQAPTLRTLLRPGLTLGLLLLWLLASSERAAASASLLELLQGEWEGKGPPGKISIRVTGESLRFDAGEDFWYEATFTLPPATYPQQFNATITDSAPPAKDVGEVVFAIVEIEGGTLTLAVDDGSALPPVSFLTAMSSYILSRTHPENAPECDPD